MKIKPAIVVVAYRRLETLKRLLCSIENAVYNSSDITLIISIDYHPDNMSVVKCAEEFKWMYGEKIVKTHKTNLGLKKHIIECGDYSLKYGAVIILEDDEIVAPSFYEYVCLAHEYYNEDERIAGISLYAHEWNGYAGKKFQPIYGDGDVYFGQFSCSWGQSWSARQWFEFREWYDKNPEIKKDERLPASIYMWKKSWGKFFARFIVEKNKYYVMPYKPVSTVFGEIGTHASIPQFEVQIAMYWGNSEWNFIPFEKGIHYDMFFENRDLLEILAKRYHISESDICIDIYALKNRKYGNKRYILTTRKLDFQLLDSFDLNMRPQDMNVLMKIKGDGIFLYDRLKREVNRRYRKTLRLEYDLGGVHAKDVFLYGLEHCGRVLLALFKRRLKL